MKKIKLFLAFALLFMALLPAVSMTTGARAKDCSGDDCGCHSQLMDCLSTCTTQTCRGQCRREAVDCSIECCSW